jgi:meso-butanediol dehydrogenase / (S,S)-butanediol dehydrogenase / diacetyl reductase
MNLDKKVALITGGGEGIGAAIAERFVAEGAKVCITGRRKEVLDKMAESLPAGAVITCSGDVSNYEDAKRMVATTVGFGGKIDVLVNNAGINMPSGAITNVDTDNWKKVIEINLMGPFLVMKEAIPHMMKLGRGSIINISSVGGLHCVPGFSAYCTSKAGLIMLTRQAALDYGPYNVRCNVVCPGGISTPMNKEALGPVTDLLGIDLEGARALQSSDVPLGRMAEPSEIAGICSFLASDDSSFMTGANLVIDGGADVVDVQMASIMRAFKSAGIEMVLGLPKM